MEQKANLQTKRKPPSRRTMVLIYFYIILLLLVLSTVATYTWFSLSRTPQVSNLSMYVTSRSGLELSLAPDGEAWGNHLSYLDMVEDSVPLRPVTWSEQDQRFYAATYGIDGRRTDQWEPLSDERNANKNTYDGYYVVGTFYARTSQNVTVSLTQAMEVEEGLQGSGSYLIGAPVWDEEKISHTNAGQGSESAVRIGIRITPLDTTNTPLYDEETFFIYEPNCDSHLDGSVGYRTTPGIHGTETLVPADRLILQTHTSWTEADPVQNGVLNYTFGEFQTPVKLFSLESNEKVMIRVYLWLEGQDVDCTNAIKEAQLLANLQFRADPEGQSGLTPIA